MLATTPTVSVVNGLRVMQVAGRVLVASRSQAGRWWDVTAGRCGCKGYEHRGRCAHVTATAPVPQVTVDPEDSILDLWPVGDGEPCAIDSTQTGRRITVLPYTPAQAAIASELYADEPQGAA
jgi:hypothetical protein